MKILRIFFFIFQFYLANNEGEKQFQRTKSLKKQLSELDKNLEEHQDQKKLEAKDLVVVLSREDQYNITVTTTQVKDEENLNIITFISNDLFKKNCYLYTDKSLDQYKYIKIVSSDLKLKFNDKSYQKLIKIENQKQLDINIMNKTVLDIQTNCLAFIEPVQQKTIYIILTEEQLLKDSQMVFTNGKYEKIPDVHGYYVYEDYYKKKINYFYRAIPIYQKFDIFEEIKPIIFIYSKDNKSFLELNINILLQTSRTFQVINFDTKTQNDVKIKLSELNLFIKVIDNVLYVMYFNKFYNNFYFFLGNNLFFYDNDKTELKVKSRNISYYIIYNDFQNKQLMTQNLFETNEQQIFEIGSDQYPVYPIIYYSEIVSSKNPQDIINIAVFHFKKQQQKQSDRFFTEPNIFCYEYYDNMIQPINQMMLFQDKYLDDSNIDISEQESFLDNYNPDSYNHNLNITIQGTRQTIQTKKGEEYNNILYRTNNITEIQQMKINVKCQTLNGNFYKKNVLNLQKLKMIIIQHVELIYVMKKHILYNLQPNQVIIL